jgi:hypothetical protein
MWLQTVCWLIKKYENMAANMAGKNGKFAIEDVWVLVKKTSYNEVHQLNFKKTKTKPIFYSNPTNQFNHGTQTQLPTQADIN